MIGEIVFGVIVYLVIGYVFGCSSDDDEVLWACVVFWIILVPIYAMICLIRTLIKLFKGDLH